MRRIVSLVLGSALVMATFPLLAAADPADVLATIDGHSITEAHADEVAGQVLQRARTQWYEARRAATDEVIARILLEREAKRRGVTTQALIEAEILGKVATVTPDDIKDFYQQNQGRIGQPLEEVTPQIERHLRQQRLVVQKNRFVGELRKGSTITYRMAPPSVAVAAIGPAKGAPTAPVTIVEFSDFECHYCKRAQAMLRSLLETYGSSLRLVYRDYPTENHPAARPAAEAARCADDQGKFWPYHDLLFANQDSLDPESLKKFAREVSLDEQAFDACVASGKHKATIDRDLQDGRKLSVQGTPTFFVNGRPVIGAQPIDVFKALIDEEIARSQHATSRPK